MIIPIRCFTCGKVLADKWEAYVRLQERQERDSEQQQQQQQGNRTGTGKGGQTDTDEGKSADKNTNKNTNKNTSTKAIKGGNRMPTGHILDSLGITKYCCRANILTHVDLSLVI
jgi:DNA-directed RNA polymerase subunit N (RpoN/RPB10)